MAEGRQKRQIKTPKRYEDENVIWNYDTQLPSKRYVYRQLRRKDINADLLNQQVYLFWPEDQQWYKGVVDEVRKHARIHIHYPEEDEYETINAGDLIRDGHIALMEERAPGQALRRGEIPVDEADRATAVYLEEEESEDDDEDPDDDMYHGEGEEDDGHDSAEAEFEATDSDEERRLRNERLRAAAARADSRKGKPIVNRNSKRYKDGSDDDVIVKRTRVDGKVQAGPVSEVQAAAQFKTAVLDALMTRIPGASGGGSKTPGAKPLGKMSAAAAAAAAEQDMRRRAREQLVAALQVAADELRREGVVEEGKIAVPGDVGVAVEIALYKAHDGLTKEYKSKFRSLVFNLKDAQNPDLRARVLQGELAPEVLVGLSANELASRQVSEARLKKQEEMAKAKFLDEETAAKYSTAAAAALKDKHHQELQQVTGKLITQDVAPAPPPDADMEADFLGKPGELQGDGGSLALDRLGSDTTPGLLDTRGSYVIDKTSSGGLGDSSMLTRPSLDGSMDVVGLDMSAGPAVRSAAKVVSLKPALPEPGLAGSRSDDADEYNPDDFIVGEDTLPSPSEPDTTSSHHHNHHSGSGSKHDPRRSSSSHAHHHAHHHHQHHKHAAAEPVVVDEDLDDLLPVVTRPEPGTPAAALIPCNMVWHGRLAAPESGVVHLSCSYLAGLQDMSRMLPPMNPHFIQDLEVKGTVRLDKVEEFMEELRARSKSRTATLGLMSLYSPEQEQGQEGAEAAAAALHKLSNFYSHKQRAGVFHPASGLEAYLLPASRLARRLLLTARLASPSQIAATLPTELGSHQLLVAIIHSTPLVVLPAQPSATPALPTMRVNDPRQALLLAQRAAAAAQPPQPVAPVAASLQPPGEQPHVPEPAQPHTASPAPHVQDAQPDMEVDPDGQEHVVAAHSDQPAEPPQAALGQSLGLSGLTSLLQHAAPAATAEGPPATPPTQQPPGDAPSGPDLQNLLAQLAPALQTLPSESQPESQPPPVDVRPQASPQHLPTPPHQYDHHQQQQQQAPAEDAPNLDISALSALASALQGQLPPSGPPPESHQPQIITGPPPPGGAPVVLMQPDGSYTILGGVEGVEGMPSMLVLPSGEAPPGPPHPGLPPHATPPGHQPLGPPPGAPPGWPLGPPPPGWEHQPPPGGPHRPPPGHGYGHPPHQPPPGHYPPSGHRGAPPPGGYDYDPHRPPPHAAHGQPPRPGHPGGRPQDRWGPGPGGGPPPPPGGYGGPARGPDPRGRPYHPGGHPADSRGRGRDRGRGPGGRAPVPMYNANKLDQ